MQLVPPYSFSLLMLQQPTVSLGLLIAEASPAHSDTPQSVGLLWTSDQPDAPDNTQHSLRHSCPGGIRTRNPMKRAATDLRLGPHGHRSRHRHHERIGFLICDEGGIDILKKKCITLKQ